MTTDLAAMAASAKREGWASAPGTIRAIQSEAQALGWRPVPTRRSDSNATTLQPTTKDAAHPHSLSASYGLGPQPLHTDGAHLEQPPDFLVLACEAGSSTPTLIWHRPLKGSTIPAVPWTQSRYGMFLVNNGRDSFFAPARTHMGYRFDPGCMTACDARSREIIEYFQAQLQNALTHEWTGSPQILVIDNRGSLHARAELAPSDEQRELKRIAFRVPEAS